MKASPIRCLISAGPTREYFDPVRYLTNPSSGKMGYALAQAAAKQEWHVDLVSGPVNIEPPSGAILHDVISGQDMFRVIDQLFDDCDLLIMSAAIMDYSPEYYSTQKVKKTGKSLTITLNPVVDILKTIATRKKHQCVLGFAAETENIIEHAKDKLQRKNCDYIAANRVNGKGKGENAFESDMNHISLIAANGIITEYGPAKKEMIAKKMIQFLAQVIKQKKSL